MSSPVSAVTIVLSPGEARQVRFALEARKRELWREAAIYGGGRYPGAGWIHDDHEQCSSALVKAVLALVGPRELRQLTREGDK